MKVKFFGVRGSLPVSSRDNIEVGGNTTSIRVTSDCIPNNAAIVVDGGSGFLPLSVELLKDKVSEVYMYFTHYHWDHIIGIPLAPTTFIKNIKMRLYGPIDMGKGPKEMMEHMMCPPFFPIDFREQKSHFVTKGFDLPRNYVILFHPKGGNKVMNVDEYETLVRCNSLLPIGEGKYHVDECLVITMYKSSHPEQTITYRFEERPTGKVFVFVSDHENVDANSNGFKMHLRGANLLVMDSQYTREKYEKMTAGYGHGTPDYCVKTAIEVGAERVGFTHHDPFATDTMVAAILAEGMSKVGESNLDVFICKDYMEVEV
jgi:phosphoribosyl 1,2-cyclic phosphodiesterase